MPETYNITVITLATPIPSNMTGSALDKHVPFSNWGTYPSVTPPLDLSGATVTKLKVEDDDLRLDGITGASRYGGGIDTSQKVAQEITLGHGADSQTLQAGQVFGFDYSALMYCVENGKIVAAYEMAFPRIPGPPDSSIGTIVGARYSMIVIPVPSNGSDGVAIEPVPFDPAKTYYYGGRVNYGKADYSIDYVDCFATGTLIDTPAGPRAVETLGAGDLVVTRDHGPQVLVWAGQCRVDAARLDLQPNLRPIRIAAGALAPGQPARDLLLSPQHRVLVRSVIAERMFGSAEILVGAKHLVGLAGIEVMAPAEGVGYHHLLFAGHEVVRSEGAWTESLFLGPRAMLGLDPSARREVAALFPGLAGTGSAPEPARRLLTGREGRKLAERHGKNGKPLVQGDTGAGRAQAIPLPA